MRKRFIAGLGFLLTAALLCGSGCGSSNSQFVVTGNGDFAQVSQADLFGRVYLTPSTSASTVQLIDPASGATFGSFDTDPSGQFIIPRGRALPARFLVRTSTNQGHVVERLVEGVESGEYLWLNVPSTLLSRYRLAHPEATAEEALGRLRATLGLSSEEGFNGTGDRQGSPFSHQVFIDRAEAIGFDSLRDQVVEAMQRGARVSFRPESTQVGRNVSIDAFLVSASIATKASIAKKIGGFLLEETASAIYEKTAEETVGEFGKMTGLSGLKIGKAAKYEAVSEALTEILDDLNELQEQVNQDYLATLTTVDKNQLDTYLTAVSTAYAQLQGLVDAYYTEIVNAGEEDVFDHGPGAIPDSRSSAVQAYASVVGQNATTALSKFLTSSNPSENLLSLQARTITSELLSSSQTKANAGNSYYPIRKDSLSEEILNNFNLYLGYITQVATLNSESGNASYLPQTVIQAGSGGSYAPPATAVTAAFHDNNALVQLAAQARAQSVAEPAGSDLVFVDATNRKMWYLPVSLGQYDEAQNGLINLEVNNWRYPSNSNKPPTVTDKLTTLQGFTRPSTLDGWRLPETSELTQIRSILNDIDQNSGGDANKTFNALVKLGFTGLTSPDDDRFDNYKKYWFNGSVQDQSFDPFQSDSDFSYYDMKDGRVRLGQQGSKQPDWSYIYVRNLSGFDVGPNFGDTTEQIVRAYGEPADYLTLDPAEGPELDGTVTINSFRIMGHMLNDDITGTISTNLTDLAEVTVTDSQGSALNSPAFAKYRIEDTANGSEETILDIVFRKPGTANVTVTVTGKTLTTQLSSSVLPELTSIVLSPQNLQLQGIPNLSTSYQYYCTGYLASGEAVDLTRKVQWSLVTASGGTTPTTIANGNSGGLLLFGTRDSLSPVMTIRADYLAGPDDPVFKDYGNSYSDTSTLAIPLQ